MEIEADLYLVFTGFNAATTAPMPVSELMRWHAIASRRYQKSKESNEAGKP